MTWTDLLKAWRVFSRIYFYTLKKLRQGSLILGVQTTQRVAERRKRSRPISDINVTPFVDVMLVLLVVFMVTAPLLVLGIPVQLPKVSKEYIIADDDTPLNIEVDNEKRIYINKKVLLSSLAPKLAQMKTANPKIKVHLRGDASELRGNCGNRR